MTLIDDEIVWTPRGRFARLVGLALLLGVLATVVGLLAGGGAPKAPPAGLPDPGAFTGWALPVSRLVADLSAVFTVGALLAPSLLMLRTRDDLRGTAVTVVRGVRWSAGVWCAAVAAQIVLSLSDLLAVPVTALHTPDLASYVWQVPQGRALSAQAALALVLSIGSRWVVNLAETTGLLVLALLALAPPVLVGHSASSGSHDVAIVSLLVHIVAASLWVGGLVSLLWFTALGAKRVEVGLDRFSTLAAWCLGAVLVSGLINASVRIGGVSGFFTTDYGALVLVKALLLVMLGSLGYLHRRRSLPDLHSDPDDAVSWRLFGRLAGLEVALMGVTFGVAVSLSRTPTPVGDQYTDPVEALLGAPLPPAPDVGRLLFGWSPSGIGLLVVLGGSVLYLAGLTVMHRKGNAWPLSRTLSWFAGLAVVAWSTFGGLGLYSHVLFSAHMGAHMLLSMVAPIFLVLGAPITLALRTLPGPRVPGEGSPRSMLNTALHSGIVRFFTNPLIATALFLGSLYALYFTGLFDTLMTNHLGHAAMELHFLLVGSLFFYVLVGIDPAPRRLPPFARLALLLIVMPFHAFFSIALMSSSNVLGEDFFSRLNRPYRTDLLADQDLGGSLSWALGELPIIVVVAAIFVQWLRSDQRDAARLDRAEDRQAAGDSELDRYNARLAQLHARSGPPQDPGAGDG